MHLSTLLLGAGLAPLALASYVVQDDYSGNNFFDMFTFDTEDDPTHGYVNYVDRGSAQNAGLIGVNNGVVTIKSDSTKRGAGRGRDSVRVTSKKQYTHGLVILDLEHMPGAACGIWPAFWMTGPNWPNSGEIDIIEGVSYQAQNAFTLHSGPGCSMVGQSCQGNQGCSIQTGGSSSYGDGFNQGKGGVYAMEWTTQNINIWFFPRNELPGDIFGPNPNPLKWKWPTAQFLGGNNCDIDQHFMNNNIVFDTTFCGDWAGGVWSQTPQCSSRAATCQDFVRDNPGAFNEAYWTIKSLKVYSWNPNAKTADAPVVQQKNAEAAPVAAPAPVTEAPKPAVKQPKKEEQPKPKSQGPYNVQTNADGSWGESQAQAQAEQKAHETYAVSSSGAGQPWGLQKVSRRSASPAPLPLPHRGLTHLPSEEKVVLSGEGAGKIIDKPGNGAKSKREAEAEPHRGLRELPSEEKVVLSGEGAGKVIDKPGNGARKRGLEELVEGVVKKRNVSDGEEGIVDAEERAHALRVRMSRVRRHLLAHQKGGHA